MDISNEQMTRLRAVELDILKQFIQVCSQLHIEYFAVQGTLLGAVKYHGFIPWDDDIDIGMMRTDYDIFLEKGQTLFPEGYFVQSHWSDPMYPHGYAKVRRNNTAFVETSVKNLPINHGIFIDIFPFDYYPDNLFKRIGFEWKKLLLRYRVRQCLYDPEIKARTFRNFPKQLLLRFSSMLYPSLKGALEKQCLLYGSIDHGKYLINNGSPWGRKECVLSDWFSNLVTVEFEGMKLKAPYRYHAYLSKTYGDYMNTLPSPDKRVSHHYISYLDFKNSYKIRTKTSKGKQ